MFYYMCFTRNSDHVVMAKYMIIIAMWACTVFLTQYAWQSVVGARKRISNLVPCYLTDIAETCSFQLVIFQGR